MRVICIEAKIDGNFYKLLKPLVEGAHYNVTNEYKDGVLYYELAEYPEKRIGFKLVTFSFEASCFIPCSEIDELELVNEKQLCI